MARPLSRLALVSALLAGSGLHWVVLQGLAWADMTRRGMEEAPFSEALAEAVSGERPCAMCLTVSRAMDAEPEPERGTLFPGAHFHFIPAPSYRGPAAEKPWPCGDVLAPPASFPSPEPFPPRVLPA